MVHALLPMELADYIIKLKELYGKVYEKCYSNTPDSIYFYDKPDFTGADDPVGIWTNETTYMRLDKARKEDDVQYKSIEVGPEVRYTIKNGNIAMKWPDDGPEMTLSLKDALFFAASVCELILGEAPLELRMVAGDAGSKTFKDKLIADISKRLHTTYIAKYLNDD
jgi:hypothetical protein